MRSELKFLKGQPYFYPAENELLLIKAAVGNEEDEVLFNFEKWINHHCFSDFQFTKNHVLPQVYDSLEEGSKKILPMVYSNFRHLEIDHHLVNQFAGFHRYVTYKNRMLRNELDVFVDYLIEDSIPYYIKKGLAYLSLYYDDYGARVTQDIDIVIPKHLVENALDRLDQKDWKSTTNWKMNSIMNSLTHAITVKKSSYEIDLHWQFSHHPVGSKWNQIIIENKKVHDKINVLSNEMNLIDTLTHGYRHNQVRPIRWVCDSCKILSSGIENWKFIVDFAKECNASLPISDGLKFLKRERLSHIPEEVLVELAELPIIGSSVKYYQISSQPTSHEQLKNVIRNALIFSKNPVSAIIKILKHYRLVWNQPSYLHLIFNGILITIEKIFFKRKLFLRSIRN